MRCKFLIPIMLALASINANAQVDSIQIVSKNPHGPTDTTRLNPHFTMLMEYPRPPIYDVWFKRVVECENLPMPPQEEIDKIQLFVVNAEAFSLPADSTGLTYDAVTNAKQHVMILSLPSIWDYDVVAHEFVHFVLWYNFKDTYSGKGKDNHPKKYFGQCNIRDH